MRSPLLSKRLRKKRHKNHHGHQRRRAHAKPARHRRRRHTHVDENVALNLTRQPPAQPPRPDPDPPAGGKLPPPPDASHRNAERLLWRAGFGPRPGDVDRVAGMGIEAAVSELVHPSGPAVLNGPAPADDDGNALAPADAWGHDHLWWLDRMVRSDQQLVERMTLIWHDWFATSDDKVGSQQLMLNQNETMRRHALGSFHDLVVDLTQDPAMVLWLDSLDNRAGSPNENYARELMELFTLGADRGAYSEQDVRELARCLTGFRATWSDSVGWHDFRYDARYHDSGSKTVFGKSGNFDWRDAVRLCLENDYHASFFVTKLWGYFVPTPMDSATQASLQAIYTGSGYGIAPVVEAILKHPDAYSDRALVKPPVVFNAGLLRTFGRVVDTTAWTWLGTLAGQQLFRPPNVAGWDDSSWLDTSTWRGRSMMATWMFRDRYVDPWDDARPYITTEDPAAAVASALDFLGRPSLSDEVRAGLLSFAESCLPAPMARWEQGPYRAMRQNALRHLILTSSDWMAN
ncbi:MAG TPA: DUF1800 domain-containing protein [Thermoleophilaceae bacterium]|jgi:hypothetical protein